MGLKKADFTQLLTLRGIGLLKLIAPSVGLYVDGRFLFLLKKFSKICGSW